MKLDSLYVKYHIHSDKLMAKYVVSIMSRTILPGNALMFLKQHCVILHWY